MIAAAAAERTIAEVYKRVVSWSFRGGRMTSAQGGNE